MGREHSRRARTPYELLESACIAAPESARRYMASMRPPARKSWEKADLALYRAKAAGATVQFYDPKMDEQLQARRTLIHDRAKPSAVTVDAAVSRLRWRRTHRWGLRSAFACTIRPRRGPALRLHSWPRLRGASTPELGARQACADASTWAAP